jgi:hypothetical protein
MNLGHRKYRPKKLLADLISNAVQRRKSDNLACVKTNDVRLQLVLKSAIGRRLQLSVKTLLATRA